MRDLADVAHAFRTARGFSSSPLYRHLLAVVADDAALLALAARTRHGQQPTFALFAAVHLLLLDGADDPLAGYYASVVGASARPVDDGTGPAFARFCARHRDAIAAILRTRLVQTNQVQRSLVLRLGLALMRRAAHRRVCVVEVGCSAGLNLRADRYAFATDHTTFGDPTSPVRIRIDIAAPDLVPDLSNLPAIAEVVGIDLEPPDLTNADDRAWLRALVWPENRHQATQLEAAMDVVVNDAPRIVRGDVALVGPDVAAALPANLPRLVVHTATRMHVPVDERPAFDAAIAAFGAGGPLLHLALEEDQRIAPGGRHGVGLTATDATGTRAIAVADGHLAWLEPLPEMADPRLGA